MQKFIVTAKGNAWLVNSNNPLMQSGHLIAAVKSVKNLDGQKIAMSTDGRAFKVLKNNSVTI
jgi:hypothetical protein